jgi:predicted ATPase/DNA-binding winged helix-turn-helix (wHTH) protein
VIESHAAHWPGRDALCFGPFHLYPQQRRLERDGMELPIGGRALDILIRLVEGSGAIVSKQDLYAAAWPGMVVEDGALRFHIASLRKTLDKGRGQGSFLTTVAGRGYSLAVAVKAPARPAVRSGGHPLPPRPRPMVGRETALAGARDALVSRGLLTLVGPAGIGKTMLAIHLAHDLAGYFAGEIAFLDLSCVTREAMALPALIMDAIAGRAPDDRRQLLILDGCEHVIEILAPLAEDLLANHPGLTLLATSREALRIEGEAVYRLFPLPCPPLGKVLTLEDALGWPAARLLAERLHALSVTGRPETPDVPFLVDICHRLDGIPLALELAAGCAQSCGLEETARLLEGHVRLLWTGRRTAPPRHQTLQAALDWSHNLLPPGERMLLRRLSVFAGGFSAQAACHIASGPGQPDDAVIQDLSELVAKSLVSLHDGQGGAPYRLLDTTRLYARRKLMESGEEESVLARHRASRSLG